MDAFSPGLNLNGQDLLAFLQRLSPPIDQFLEIRIVVPDVHSAPQFFCTTVADAIEVIERWNGRGNVYVGACPRSRRSGNREAVTFVLAAWVDLDFHQIDGTDRERAEGVARERLTQFPFPPTVLVFTGNGIQAWWFFHSPIRISDEYPAGKFEAIDRGIAKVLGGDAVHDLARLLRVPGTRNLPDAKKRARGCVPVMARLLIDDGPTHDPCAFKKMEVWPPRKTKRASAISVELPTRPNDEVVDEFLRLLERLGEGHVLTRTWKGQRTLRDTSRSGWDMALANQLYRAGVGEDMIAHILRAFPRGRGPAGTDDYLRRTVANARTSR